MAKSVRLTRFRDILQEVEKECALLGVINPMVVMSSDPEGNSYGTIDAESFEIDVDNRILIIYPLDERLELEDVK